jgi:hypothetical protein
MRASAQIYALGSLVVIVGTVTEMLTSPATLFAEGALLFVGQGHCA